MKTIMEMAKALPLLLLAVLPLTSCSEDSNTVEEYPDWQAQNTTYINNLNTRVTQLIASGSTEWKKLPAYSKGDDATLSASDYIYVQVISSGDGTESPLSSDMVSVSYSGRMIPSTSYPEGYVFDYTYSGTYNPATSVPASSLTAGDYIVGFTTALLYMHRGDHWRVHIPYQLAYNSSSAGNVQPYSTLIFDIILEDFGSN